MTSVEMKDTGIDWLSQIPAHWKVVPFWSEFSRQKSVGHPTEELLSVYRDYGVVPKSSRDDNNNKASEDLSTYQLVEQGDLVINKMKSWQGSIAVSQYRGIVSPAYFEFKHCGKSYSPYLHYLLRSQPYITAYKSTSKGIRLGQWDQDPDALRGIRVVTPPLPEQERIADYLDRETGRLDALVAEQENFPTTLPRAITKIQACPAMPIASGPEYSP